MRTVEDLVVSLRKRGMRFVLEGEKVLFQAPRSVLTAEVVDDLKVRRADIIALLARESANQHSIIAVPRSGTLRPSREQESWWHAEQSGMITRVSWTHLKRAFRIRQPLDVAVLERALKEIVRRQEILRSAFVEVDGCLTVRIDESPDVDIEFARLHDIAGGKTEEEGAREWVAGLCTRPFDMKNGRLIRFGLLELGKDDHILVIVAHHIIHDQRSGMLFSRELSAIYPAFAGGKGSPLTDLSVQYVDYAAWQRRCMSDAIAEIQANDIRRRLDGARMQLPVRTTVEGEEGAKALSTFKLAGGLLQTISEVARRESTTPYVVIMTALKMALAQWSGQSDVAIGSVTEKRSRPELSNVMGLFVGLDPIRTDLSGDPSFEEAMRRVACSYLDATNRGTALVEGYQSHLNVLLNFTRAPVPSFSPQAQQAPVSAMPAPFFMPMSLLGIVHDTPSPVWELAIHLAEEGDGISGATAFNSAHFTAEALQGFHEQFQKILELGCRDRSLTIGKLQRFAT